jgi:hypothetical protein
MSDNLSEQGTVFVAQLLSLLSLRHNGQSAVVAAEMEGSILHCE